MNWFPLFTVVAGSAFCLPSQSPNWVLIRVACLTPQNDLIAEQKKSGELKAQLDAANGDKKKLEGDVAEKTAAIGKLGEEIKKAKEDAAKMNEDLKKSMSGDFDKKTAELTKQHADKVKALEAQIADVKKQLDAANADKTYAARRDPFPPVSLLNGPG